jgi:hypothetical protein
MLSIGNGGAAARLCEAVAGQQDQLTESAGRVGQAEGGNRLISPGLKLYGIRLLWRKAAVRHAPVVPATPAPLLRRSPGNIPRFFPAVSKNYIPENLTENVNSSSKVGEKACPLACGYISTLFDPAAIYFHESNGNKHIWKQS